MKLYDKIPVYSFELDNDIFETIEVPTSMYKNKVEQIWQSYSKYPEMANTTDNSYIESNNAIISKLVGMGICKLNMGKKVFDKSFYTLLIDLLPEDTLKYCSAKIERDMVFLKMKSSFNKLGIFWSENYVNQIQELDWLPIPTRNMINNADGVNQNNFSVNICHWNDDAWLVVYYHKFGATYVYQSLNIGKTILFYDEFESFAPQKLIEILQILPNEQFSNILRAWDLFFVNRYKYFFGNHPYIDSLDPEEYTEQDKVRMIIIWLNRLQEFVAKLYDLHSKKKTIILSKTHNEMNGEYVSYDITYTPEIRKELIEKKESFQLYTIANDWFVS